MASQRKEPTFSIGSVIWETSLDFDYLKQQFVQATNPAMDPLREWLVNIRLKERFSGYQCEVSFI